MIGVRIRFGRQLLCSAAALVVALALAAPTSASRAEIVNGELRFQADPGRANDVVAEGFAGVHISIVDRSFAAITPGPGCWRTPLGPSHRVRCNVHVDSFSASLGDLRDHFLISNPLPAGVTTFVSGGSDDDVLIGGPGHDNLFGREGNDELFGGSQLDYLEGDCSTCGAGSDYLEGGHGPDFMNGGPGKDTADYSSRTADVDVSLDGTLADLNAPSRWNDGESGEGDNVLSSVEVVWGGDGRDVLTGNASANTLHGGGSSDRLDGDGGADDLIGGDGVLDFARYQTRSADVEVTLDGVADDGESGEGDNVHADVEAVAGGSGNDTLIGNPRVTNFLFGGGGNADRLDGGEGSSRCASGQLCEAPAALADVLDGGPGTGDIADYASRDAALSLTLDGTDNDGAPGERDMLSAVEGFIGGSGDDYISGDGSSNRLTGGRGVDGLYGWGGADFIDSRDWRTDYVYCGDGAAADEAFDDDIDEAPAGDCETRALLSSEVFAGR